MTPAFDLCDQARGFAATPLVAWRRWAPWALVAQAPQLVRALIANVADAAPPEPR